MNKTLLVMLNELRTTPRRKSFMILALGVPLVLGATALIVMVVNRDVSSASVASDGQSTRPSKRRKGMWMKPV